jgi:hypothetical protein
MALAATVGAATTMLNLPASAGTTELDSTSGAVAVRRSG